MIFGTVTVDAQAVSTHRDSYLLPSITVVSVRRPFLAGGLLLAGGLAGFAAGFADLLYPDEIKAIAAACTACLVVGLAIGRLQLLSRDLRGSELAGMVWGTYGHLNRVRRQIAAAMRTATAETRR